MSASSASRRGDRITWTKNLPSIGVTNSQIATITAVNPARGSFTFEQGGRRTTLQANAAEARHLDHGYAQTAQKLQGQTADRALIHAEHWRLNLINQRSFYVLISRAKDGVIIATSDRAGLVAAIRERSGEQQAALDELETRLAPSVAQAAMQQTVQEQERERAQEQELGNSESRLPHGSASLSRDGCQEQTRRQGCRSRPNREPPPAAGNATTTTTLATET